MTTEPSLPPGYAESAPIVETMRVQRCPVCGNENRTFYAQGYDYELQTCRNLWTFWRCDDCTAVWLDSRPATAALGAIYPAHYYAYSMPLTPSTKRVRMPPGSVSLP